MLAIDTIPLGPLGTNCYLLTNTETKRAVVIDPGMNPQPLIRRVQDLEVEAILLTHAHFDHIGGVDELRKLKKCPVYLHDLEADWLSTPKKNGSLMWPEVGPPVSTDPAEYALDEGQVLQLLGESIKVFHTPGHSPGSVSFLLGDTLFSGDVLFKLSVGRTDLTGGNHNDLMDSITGKLFKMDDRIQVYPGHGPRTSIGFEKANNPYID
jgi:hydroxyacylglutathione hydrolase